MKMVNSNIEQGKSRLLLFFLIINVFIYSFIALLLLNYSESIYWQGGAKLFRYLVGPEINFYYKKKIEQS